MVNGPYDSELAREARSREPEPPGVIYSSMNCPNCGAHISEYPSRRVSAWQSGYLAGVRVSAHISGERQSTEVRAPTTIPDIMRQLMVEAGMGEFAPAKRTEGKHEMAITEVERVFRMTGNGDRELEVTTWPLDSDRRAMVFLTLKQGDDPKRGADFNMSREEARAFGLFLIQETEVPK